MNRQEAYKILADADRRHIIHKLIKNDGLSTISDLSQQLASCSDTPEESDTALERAEISLVHNHLPRLEDHGVLEYDTRSGDVVLTDAETLEHILNTVEGLETAAAETV
jgi:hypothetical protein